MLLKQFYIFVWHSYVTYLRTFKYMLSELSVNLFLLNITPEICDAHYIRVRIILCKTKYTEIIMNNLINDTEARSNAFASYCKQFKKNSMVWVRERTIPTERVPFVDEVITNFLRIESATWSAWRIPTAVFWVFETGAATFLSSSSSVVLTRPSGPRSRPTTFFW
jgi:hypothetical protein